MITVEKLQNDTRVKIINYFMKKSFKNKDLYIYLLNLYNDSFDYKYRDRNKTYHYIGGY